MPRLIKDQRILSELKPKVENHIGPITQEHQRLASILASRHGRARLARESSGIHVYLPCPDCIETNGRSELYKMHLAVNLDKYIQNMQNGSGPQLSRPAGGSAGDSDRENIAQRCACCMKTGQPYLMVDLLTWETLESRSIPDVSPTVIEQDDLSAFLEDDGCGHMVPKSPGLVADLSSLDYAHPGIEYLRYRGYAIETLQRMYDAKWCDEERQDANTYYARIKGDWQATPQGRLIFYIWQDGVKAGWQARIPEITDDRHRYYWHPYRKNWEAVQARNPDGSWDELIEPMEKKFDPRKYLFPRGVLRNRLLMGYDAARLWNEQENTGKLPFIVIAEGPLSAAKLGSPGVASMGKHFSDAQAELAARFPLVFYVHDNDKAGNTGIEKFERMMGRFGQVGVRSVVVDLPSEFKDMGECSTEQAQQIIADELKKL